MQTAVIPKLDYFPLSLTTFRKRIDSYKPYEVVLQHPVYNEFTFYLNNKPKFMVKYYKNRLLCMYSYS